MREIKFRAWDKKNKRWATDYDTIYIADDGRQYIYYDGYDSCLKHVVLEISQYTGIKDRTGKEIYEGDIVFLTVEETFNASDEKGVIVWVNSIHAHFGIEFDSVCLPIGDERLGLPEEDFEVIGNIYEHPELLNNAPTLPQL